MDIESMNKNKHNTDTLLQTDDFDDALALITAQPKRQYTQQEIDEARENLALMNDRVFLGTFADNKCDTFFDNLTTQGKQST